MPIKANAKAKGLMTRPARTRFSQLGDDVLVYLLLGADFVFLVLLDAEVFCGIVTPYFT
jgi:hypothetical protein